MKKRTLKKLAKIKNIPLTNVEKKIASIIITEYPLSYLEKYREHRRLKVFCLKGTKCSNCDATGTRLIKRRDVTSAHIDLYTRDFRMITVDHILPKSKGGSNNIENLRPMCCICNSRRGSEITLKDEQYIRDNYLQCAAIHTE